ncbi:MAG: low-specificity L-threonine aldolase [Pseudomonadota bacterium]
MYDTSVSSGSDKAVIDLRSDTVTRPSAKMRELMATASVGDDVYGDDPTVNLLEETVADLLGKEASLFVASGTQSNLIALLTHCARGEEYISGNAYHVARYEAGGAAALGGIVPHHLQVGPGGAITPADVKAAIKGDDVHLPITRLVSLENTVYGEVQDQANLDAVADLAHENGLSVHLDGARLMNAVVKSNMSARDVCRKMDTVSLCLSKGLGAPVGSVLAGPRDFIRRARRSRKMLGGGMRQAGVLAACGLYALQHNVERLRDDHERAKKLADALDDFHAIEVDHSRVDTNMVFVKVDPDHTAALNTHLRAEGIILGAPHETSRLVVHLDINDADIEHVVSKIGNYFAA